MTPTRRRARRTTARAAALLTGLAVAVTALAGCSSSASSGAGLGSSVPPVSTDAFVRSSVATADTAFAGLLLSATGREQPTGNLVISPASVALALQMVLPGGRGATAQQLARALRLDGVPPQQVVAATAQLLATLTAPRAGGATLRVADTAWVAKGYPVEPAFLHAVTSGNLAALKDADFATDPDRARERINALVADQTHGRIPALMPAGSVDALTRLVLTDALWFKGAWARPSRPPRRRRSPARTAAPSRSRPCPATRSRSATCTAPATRRSSSPTAGTRR